MSPRLRWRKFVSGFMLTMTGVCALVAVSVLFFILGYLIYHGGTSINWDFFTKLPKPVGETGGGMANAIVGSAKLLLLASLLGAPIGFMGAIYLAEFSGSIPFLMIHVVLFAVWIVINVGWVPGMAVFDAYPFGLLTMAVSLEAMAVQVPALNHCQVPCPGLFGAA